MTTQTSNQCQDCFQRIASNRHICDDCRARRSSVRKLRQRVLGKIKAEAQDRAILKYLYDNPDLLVNVLRENSLKFKMFHRQAKCEILEEAKQDAIRYGHNRQDQHWLEEFDKLGRELRICDQRSEE